MLKAYDARSMKGRRPPGRTAVYPLLARERLGPWRERLRLENGRELWLRPIEIADAEPLRAAFALLSPEEVRLRFLHPMKEMSPAMATSLTALDPATQFALVVAEPLPPGEALIGAVGRISIDPDSGDAEFGLIVGRLLAGNGLGSHLLRRLIQWCRRRGVRAIYGDVLIENGAMLELTDALGFERKHIQGEHGIVRVTKVLTA
jgi:RimJ/RimL family protein N-acetyltransferase